MVRGVASLYATRASSSLEPIANLRETPLPGVCGSQLQGPNLSILQTFMGETM